MRLRSGRVTRSVPVNNRRRSGGSCGSCNNVAAQYAQGDDCKRHRKPDGKPKTVNVVTYRRRKPN